MPHLSLKKNPKRSKYKTFPLNVVEPPPSYESIYGRVKAAQLEAESKPQFFKKVMTIIMGTCKSAGVIT